MTEPASSARRSPLSLSSWVRFGVPAIALGLVWLLYRSAPVLFTSLMLALVLFYLLHPIVDFLESRSIRRGVGSGLALLALMLGVYLLWTRLLWVGADLRAKTDLGEFQNNLASRVSGVVGWAEKRFSPLVGLIERALQTEMNVPEGSRASALTLPQRMDAWIDQTASEMAPRVALGLGRLAWDSFLTVVLTSYFAFFFLKDGRNFKKTLLQWVPNRYFELALRFFNGMTQRVELYLQRMVLDCLVVGYFVGVGSALVGAPYPVMFGLIAFLLNTIPLVGPLLYGGIGLAIITATGSPDSVFFGFLAVFVLSRLCDDLIFVPTIYGRSHKIHLVVIVIVVVLGASLAGVWGMLLAVPITSVVLLSIEIAREISHAQHLSPLPPSVFAPFA